MTSEERAHRAFACDPGDRWVRSAGCDVAQGGRERSRVDRAVADGERVEGHLLAEVPDVRREDRHAEVGGQLHHAGVRPPPVREEEPVRGDDGRPEFVRGPRLVERDLHAGCVGLRLQGAPDRWFVVCGDDEAERDAGCGEAADDVDGRGDVDVVTE